MRLTARQISRVRRSEWRGFTLVELLVVIGILLVVTTVVIVTFNANSGADRMRNAARIAQSAILGGRDRALHAKERRGIRFIRDPNDSTLVIGFTYLQPLPLQTYGQPNAQTVRVCRPETIAPPDFQGVDVAADSPRYVIVEGVDGQRIFNLDIQGMMPLLGMRVQIPASTGQWYVPVPVNGVPPYYVSMQGTLAVFQVTADVVRVDNPMPNVISLPQTSSDASLALDLGNELMPNQQLIPLPSGIVLDLKWCSTNVSSVWNVTPPSNIDLMYSPRGMLHGPIAAQGPIHLLLRDIQDATDLTIDPRSTTQSHRERLVLSIFPQTGNCQTFPVDATDVLDNITGTAGVDGLADDLFHFAKIGSAAGQ